MNFKSFFLVLVGMSFLGMSGGYVVGFYLQNVIPENSEGYWFYISGATNITKPYSYDR